MAGISRSNEEFSVRVDSLTPEEREMKKMAKSFYLEELEIEKQLKRNDRKTTRVRSG